MAASVTLSGKFNLRTELSDDIGLANVKTTPALTIIPKIDSGETVTYVYTLSGEAIASSPDTIDLTGGTISDALGNALTFDKIHAIGVYSAESSNANMTVTVQDCDSSDTDMVFILPPLACVFWNAPTGATGATGIGDITIAGTNTDTYDLIVVGSPS